MVSIKDEIIPNPPFQYSRLLLVILSVWRNLDFGDNREVLLIDPYFMCYDNRNGYFMIIKLNKTLETHEQIVGSS